MSMNNLNDNSQKLLITGGAGYIGSHTTHFLIANGYKARDVIVFDNLVYGHREFLSNDVIFIHGDLLNKTEIESVFKEYNIDAVLHFAAYAYVGESMQDPGKYFENNIVGGLNLLGEMAKYECKKIVFSSSCAVYGIPERIPVKEVEKENPVSPYGESKLMFEKILGWYEKIYNINYVSLRYFNAAGADFGIGEDHNPETHLIPLAIFAALGIREKIKIFGDDYNTPDGTCIRDYIHVTDLADAHLKAMEYLKKYKRSDVFNLGSHNGTSVRDIIGMVKHITGRDFTVEEAEKRDGDPPVLLAYNEKAKGVLCWEPQKNLGEIIQSAWAWHKSQHQ